MNDIEDDDEISKKVFGMFIEQPKMLLDIHKIELQRVEQEQ